MDKIYKCYESNLEEHHVLIKVTDGVISVSSYWVDSIGKDDLYNAKPGDTFFITSVQCSFQFLLKNDLELLKTLLKDIKDTDPNFKYGLSLLEDKKAEYLKIASNFEL